MSSYPEHEKLQALNGANNTIGDFLTWLGEQGYVIAKYGKPYERDEDCSNPMHREKWVSRRVAMCPKCRREGSLAWYSEDYICKRCRDAMCEECQGSLLVLAIYHEDNELWPAQKNIEQWIGEHFGVDPKKLSAEKDQMLRQIREAAA